MATGEHVNRGPVYLHDLETARLVKTIDPGEKGVGWVAFTLEEGLLAVHSMTEANEPFVGFWDIGKGKEVRRLTLPPRAERDVLSPNGHLLAAYWPQRDHVSLLDVSTGKERQQLPQKDVWAVVFSVDGRTLACGDSKGVTLWEIASGKQRCRIEASAAGRTYLFNFDVLRFSPSGRWLARKADRAIQLCDVLRGRVVHAFTQHDDSVMSLAFTFDDRILASSSWDTTILLWDVATVAARQPRLQDAPSGTALLTAWEELASADAQVAYRALGALTEAPSQSLPLIRERLRPAVAPDANQIERWLAELDSSRFADRERAKRELERLEGRAEPALRRLLAGAPTAEARRRAEDLLGRLQPLITDPEMLRQIRAVEVLEYMATPDAKQVLEEVARGAPESRLTQEAKGALLRLAKRPSGVP